MENRSSQGADTKETACKGTPVDRRSAARLLSLFAPSRPCAFALISVVTLQEP